MKKTMQKILGSLAAVGLLIASLSGCSGVDRSSGDRAGASGQTFASGREGSPVRIMRDGEFGGDSDSDSGEVPGSGIPADTIPPAIPAGLSGAGSQSKIAVSWTAVVDASAYKVFRDGVLISTVLTASMLDVGLTAATTYCYAVVAADAAGNESLPSAPLCITTRALLDAAAPGILLTSPANLAVDVQTDPLRISAIFSEPMNLLSVVRAGSFTVAGVAGTVDVAPATGTATFTPSAMLAPGTTYTATISRNVADAAGNLMGTDYIWTFTTTTTPVMTIPSVISTAPADGATAVPVPGAITVAFSEPMDPLSVMDPSHFSINPGVPGLVSYDIATMTAIFTPSTPLAPATVYTCTVANNVSDLAGNRIPANHRWSFTTAP